MPAVSPGGALRSLRRTEVSALPAALAKIEAVCGHCNDREFQVRLNAYRAIVAHQRGEAVRGLARSSAEATIELNELVRVLRFDVARIVVKDYVATWPKVPQLLTQATLYGTSGDIEDQFRDEPTADVQVIAKPGASTTFVVFCGIRHQFGINLNVLHHCWLAKYGANIVYLRDFSEALYLSGIRSLGYVEETVDALRATFASLGTQRLICIGNSAGVFGCLYYAVRLNAELALCFSGPSSLDIGLEFTEKQSYRRIQDLHQQGKAHWPNLRDLYRQHADVRASLHFGDQNVADRKQAENLAGPPNVSLHPLHGISRHFIIDQLVRMGVFQDALASAARFNPG